MNPNFTRKVLLVILCIGTLIAISGCGITLWQQQQDIIWDAHHALHAPTMEAAIKDARPGVPRCKALPNRGYGTDCDPR